MNTTMTPQLNASSRILYQEALSRGVHCTFFDDKDLILMEKDGHHWYTRGSRTTLQSSVGKSIADDKALTKKVLHSYDLPTAKGVVIKKSSDFNQLKLLNFPIVMKPLAERHGKGVVVGIKNFEEAKSLFEKVDSSMLFEEMLSGVEYRIVCVDFKFVAAAFRKPAHVVGDGTHTVQEMIDEKNKHPWRGEGHMNNLSLIKVDESVMEYLTEQQESLTSIPAKDKTVFLRKTANLSTGGEAWDVTKDVCSENAALFEKIAKVCDLNTVGIDIMCDSLSIPIIEQPRAGVIEVNASPGLRMHHFPIQGQPANIAEKILDMVMSKGK